MRNLFKELNHSNYLENTSTIIPKVVYCKQENHIHTRSMETLKYEYFTIESLEDNNLISLVQGTQTNTITVQISTDDGTTWISKTTAQNSTIDLGTLSKGEKMIFKGTNAKINGSTTGTTAIRFKTSKTCNISGNLLSMIYGEDFETHTEGPNSMACFAYLFSANPLGPWELGARVVDASNLYIVSPSGPSGSYYYYNLFYKCQTLKIAPQNFPDTIKSTYQYYYMFSNCYALMYPPKILPALTLTNYCYAYMFTACRSLMYTPEIMATTMGEYSCYLMFNSCSYLVSAKDLHATTLAKYCCYQMFDYCSSLVKAPALPATEMKDYCYGYMFRGCTNLQVMPDLPATTLATYCYLCMFYGDTALYVVPKSLPATTLATYCYDQMFRGCSAMTYAPELPASTLTNYCYYQMFYGCSALKYIKCSATSIVASNALNGWVTSVPSGCIYIKNGPTTFPASTSGIPTSGIQYNQFDRSNEITNFDAIIANPTKYITMVANQDSYIGLYKCSTNQEIWISIDGSNWTPLHSKVGQGYKVTSGTAVYLYGNLSAPNTNSDYTQFGISGSFTGSGEITSLFNMGSNSSYSVPAYAGYYLFAYCRDLSGGFTFDLCTSVGTNAFDHLFFQCHSLSIAPEILPATTLSNYCYQYMFSGCRSLTSIPELPATTLGTYCYYYMFQECTSLISTCELPATILKNYCYTAMFGNCSNLKTILPIHTTTLADYCYQSMFSGCLSLTTPIDLPVTTLKQYCYSYMFRRCISLTSMPELPATTLATQCYGYMFDGCEKLTHANRLPGITAVANCYMYMFARCRSLKNAPELISQTLASACYYAMFYCCSNITNTPTLPNATLYSQCYRALFQGCISLTEAPTLSSYALADYCYYAMFADCINLRQAPIITPQNTTKQYCYAQMFQNCIYITRMADLPATILTQYCYYRMYEGCTSITQTPVLSATTMQSYCYGYMLAGTSITQAPELPATTLNTYCYYYMLGGTLITEVPELPATVLKNYCYAYMFQYCSRITSAPELPIMTLADYCYAGMYYGCVNLENIPHILPAKTLKQYCYYQMFRECPKITKSPVLPATTLVRHCYSYMFYNCSNLSEVTALFTTKPSTSLSNYWLNGVKSSGIFYRNQNATWSVNSAHGKPSAWTFNYFYNMNNLISTIDAEWSTDYNKQNLRDIITGSIIGSNLTDYSSYIHNNYIQFNNSFYLTYNLQSVFDAIENKAFSMEVVFNWQSKAGSSGSTIYALGQNNTGGNYRIIWTWGSTNVTGVAFYQTGTSTTPVSALTANVLYKIIITVNAEGVGTYYLYNLQTNTLVQTVTLSKGAATLNPETNNIIQINSLPGYTQYRSNMKVCSVRFYNKTLLTSDPEITNGNVLDAQRFTTLS